MDEQQSRDWLTQQLKGLHNYPAEIQGAISGGFTQKSSSQDAFPDETQKLRNVDEPARFGLVIIGTDGVLSAVNQEFVEMFGYEPHEIPTGREWFRKAYPDAAYRHGVIAAWVEYLSQARPGEIRSRTFTVTCKDGTEKIIDFRPVQLESGQHLMTCEDITDRIRAEATLRESEARVSLALSGANLGLWDWDLTTGNAFWTSRTAETLGYGPNSSLPDFRRLKGLVHVEDWPQFSRLLNRHLEGREPIFETECRMRNAAGKWQWILIRGKTVEFNEFGKPVRMAGIALDVTRGKTAQEGVVQAQKFAAVAELASGVAHNFNNVLQIVLGGAQLAQSDLDLGQVAAARDSLKHIVESAKSGAETIKRLQEFARVRIAPRTGQGEVFDLSRTVQDAIAMTRPWWQTRPATEGSAISLKRDLQKSSFVKGSENDLFEVAVNLIKNAAEALPQGGRITVGVKVAGPHVKLSVQDSGPGIPRQDMERIFEPFWTTKSSQGTGMGLPSSLGIVSRHGGKMSVESREGEGAEFSVLLPLSQKEETTKKPDLIVCQEIRLHILVVDDLPLVTNQLESALTKFGQVVSTALDGRQALRIFRETDIDLIICDLGMPGFSGWQVGESVKKICTELGRDKPPFIMLTGWGGQLDERDRMMESGVDRILEKPVDGYKLMGVIQELTHNVSAA